MRKFKKDFTVEGLVCSKANGSDEVNGCWNLKNGGTKNEIKCNNS